MVICFVLFCSEARPMQVALETGHDVDLFHWTLLVVCFSSPRRDPKPSVGQCYLPFLGRSTHTSCFIAACQAPVKPALHLLGRRNCLFIYRLTGLLSVYTDFWIVDLELSSPFYSIIYCYYTLKCGLFHDWAWKFFQAWVLIWQRIWTTTTQDRGDYGPMLYCLCYAALL